jgi:hypothetical protein
MKIYVRNFLLILTALALPLSAANGQNKKIEKKIKVVMDDGSGAKTEIDTTFTDDTLPDSVILKNGKVFYFAGTGDEEITGKSPKKMLVTVTSTSDGEKNKEQTVIVTSDDSTWTNKAEGDGNKHVYSYSLSGSSGHNSGNHMVIVSDNGKDISTGEEKVIIIKDGKVIGDESDKDYDVLENLEKNDNKTEMTKYVIAKDGVVVTVESKDEEKAKNLIKDIENRLGVKKDDGVKKETVNTQTKITVKK